MPLLHGLLNGIVMSGDKVQGDGLLPAVFQKRPDPDLVAAAADGGAAHPEPFVHFLHRLEGAVKKLKILLHVGVLPEARQIGFVPDLHGPGHYLLPPISGAEMCQKRLYHIIPPLIGGRRRGISLPVKDRLCAAGQLLRHETKLQKRLQAQPSVAVHHPVHIGIVIFRRAVLRFLADGQIVAEQAVSPDVPKPDFMLYQLKLPQIFLLQRKPHSPRADAEIHLIVKFRTVLRTE